MKLSKPREVTFILAVLTAVLAAIAAIANIPGVSPYSFWLLMIAFVILALGVTVRGM